MFVTFMLLVAIVYLNLLVAIMTSGYTEVRKANKCIVIKVYLTCVYSTRRVELQMLNVGGGKAY